MKGARKPPDFYPAESFQTISAGMLSILLGLAFLIGPMFLNRKGFTDLLNCLGISFIVLLAFALGFLLISMGIMKENKKREWLKTTASATASIVGCNKEDAWDLNYLDTIRWVLDIVMDISLETEVPNSISAEVYITESQFKKYINRKSVNIYYSKKDPFEFLLEDEL